MEILKEILLFGRDSVPLITGLRQHLMLSFANGSLHLYN